jgi:uncharacterized protein YgiM (DUF1202 family)
MKTFFRALMLFSVATTTFAADIVYVQSSKAKIFDSPTFQAPLLATANKGDALTLLETRDQWVKISYQQHTGWVPALLVNNKPPQEKITVIKGQDGGAPQDDARRRASASASAAAARGLRQDERARASDQGQTNYPAVEKMEANKVNENDVETFIQAPAK